MSTYIWRDFCCLSLLFFKVSSAALLVASISKLSKALGADAMTSDSKSHGRRFESAIAEVLILKASFTFSFLLCFFFTRAQRSMIVLISVFCNLNR